MNMRLLIRHSHIIIDNKSYGKNCYIEWLFATKSGQLIKYLILVTLASSYKMMYIPIGILAFRIPMGRSLAWMKKFKKNGKCFYNL